MNEYSKLKKKFISKGDSIIIPASVLCISFEKSQLQKLPFNF